MLLLKIMLTLLIVICTFFRIIKDLLVAERAKDSPSSSRLEDIQNILKYKKWFLLGWGIIFGVLAIFSSVFTTDAKEIAFTTFMGKTTPVVGSGIHFNVPFIGGHQVYDATSKNMTIGYDEATEESQVEESIMITEDFNLVNIDFYAEYLISDAIEYKYGSNNPETILRNELLAAIRNTVGQFSIDDVMTTGKAAVETQIFETVTAALEERHLGIQVTNVSLQDSEPPTADVQTAFTDVETARQDADQKKNEGEQVYNTKIPAAEATAISIKEAAEAARIERENEAAEEVAKFNAIYQEYINNPEVVKKRLYFDALNDVLPNMQIIIGDDTKVISVQEGTSKTASSTAKLVEATEQ